MLLQRVCLPCSIRSYSPHSLVNALLLLRQQQPAVARCPKRRGRGEEAFAGDPKKQLPAVAGKVPNGGRAADDPGPGARTPNQTAACSYGEGVERWRSRPGAATKSKGSTGTRQARPKRSPHGAEAVPPTNRNQRQRAMIQNAPTGAVPFPSCDVATATSASSMRW